jgi:sugar phosphate isomerase/epimerase
MKLAFTTLGNPDWTFGHTLAEAKRLGFSAIEVRGVEGIMLAQDIPYFSPARQAETKRALSDAGLSLCGFGTSVNFHDPDKYAAAMDEGRAAIDVCARMGIPYVRVFGDRIASPEARGGVIQRAISGIKTLCAHAQGTSVTILLEVHGDFNTVDVIMDVRRGLDSLQNFGILWDLAHSDKIYGDDFEPFYACVKPLLRHVHIKDHHRDGGAFRLCLVGQGDIPIRAIVERLLSDGYSGYFSLEWEKKWHPELPEPEIAYPGFIRYMREIS